MKKDIAEYVAVCDVCHRVKAEHQKPAGLLQPMPIPEWKRLEETSWPLVFCLHSSTDITFIHECESGDNPYGDQAWRILGHL